MSEENLFEVSGSEMTDYSQKHAKLAPHFLGYRNVNSTEDSPLKNFVKSHGGHTIISKVLIANNGIAAVKEIRSAMKELFNSLQWLHQKIWKLTLNI